MFLLLSAASLIERWLTFSAVADITACVHLENDEVIISSLLLLDWIHDFVQLIMLSSACDNQQFYFHGILDL